MTPQELKASILQLAIQGRLVEQRPEEGTGGELLEKILAAKGEKGTKKNSRAETPRRRGKTDAAASFGPGCPVSPDSPVLPADAPFDIPESWVWVRLGEVVSNHGQKKPTGDFSYIDIGSIDNMNQRLSDSETIIHADNASPRARKIVQKGDVIYATVRPYLHNVCVIDREFSREPIASTGFAVMACADCLDNKYLFYFLLSPDFDRYANSSENSKGVAYPAISDKRLYDALIPLPPLAEQKRIVAKIEELLPYIDRYEKAWSKLEDFNKRFPGDMQKSLLQMAIQGKLVEQRPEEGTGGELLEKILAAKGAKGAKKNSRAETPRRRGKTDAAASFGPGCPVSPDSPVLPADAPFDIPESWVWVRLGEVVDILDSMRRPITKADRKPGPYPYYGASCIQDYVADYIFDEPLVLLGEDGAKWGRGDNSAYRIGGKTWVNNHAHVLRPLGGVEHDYLVHALCISDLTSFVTGTTVPKLNQARMCGIPIPLPPLAEQKRIVAKIEELLPLCERLK